MDLRCLFDVVDLYSEFDDLNSEFKGGEGVFASVVVLHSDLERGN